MGWFSDDSSQANDYNKYQEKKQEYQNTERKPKLSHELIAAAASYEAAKAYENHVAANGRPDNHAQAKEIFAGFAGAFIDREVETHGLNALEREKAKYDAHKHAEEVGYGGGPW